MQESAVEILKSLSKKEIKVLKTICKSGEAGASDADLRSKHGRAASNVVSILHGKGLIKRKLLEKDIQKAEEAGLLPVSDAQKLLSYPHKPKGQKRTPIPTGNHVLTPFGERVFFVTEVAKNERQKESFLNALKWALGTIATGLLLAFLVWKLGWL